MDRSKSDYAIIQELHLVIEYYYGSSNAEIIIKTRERQLADANFRDIKRALLVFENVAVSEDIASEVEKYAAYLSTKKEELASRKIAFVTNNPVEVVIGYLSQLYLMKLNKGLEVFSTVPAALSFLGIETSSKRVLDAIDKLRKS